MLRPYVLQTELELAKAVLVNVGTALLEWSHNVISLSTAICNIRWNTPVSHYMNISPVARDQAPFQPEKQGILLMDRFEFR